MSKNDCSHTSYSVVVGTFCQNSVGNIYILYILSILCKYTNLERVHQNHILVCATLTLIVLVIFYI